jgi:cell division protein FtsB
MAASVEIRYCKVRRAMPVPPTAPRRSAGPEPLRRRRVPETPAPPAWRRRALNYLLIFVIVVLVTDGLVGENGFFQRARVREAYQQERLAVDALKQANQRLLQEIRLLKYDPATVEGLARQELGFVRPGEVLFIIRDVKPGRR